MWGVRISLATAVPAGSVGVGVGSGCAVCSPSPWEQLPEEVTHCAASPVSAALHFLVPQTPSRKSTETSLNPVKPNQVRSHPIRQPQAHCAAASTLSQPTDSHPQPNLTSWGEHSPRISEASGPHTLPRSPQTWWLCLVFILTPYWLSLRPTHVRGRRRWPGELVDETLALCLARGSCQPALYLPTTLLMPPMCPQPLGPAAPGHLPVPNLLADPGLLHGFPMAVLWAAWETHQTLDEPRDGPVPRDGPRAQGQTGAQGWTPCPGMDPMPRDRPVPRDGPCAQGQTSAQGRTGAQGLPLAGVSLPPTHRDTVILGFLGLGAQSTELREASLSRRLFPGRHHSTHAQVPGHEKERPRGGNIIDNGLLKHLSRHQQSNHVQTSSSQTSGLRTPFHS